MTRGKKANPARAIVRRVEPNEGQESVWDYPRPPRCEPTTKLLEIVFNGITLAKTARAYRVLETSHPPVYYFPPEDVKMKYLTQTSNSSFCEWKGRARYYTITVGERSAVNAAWFYSEPTPDFAFIKGYIAFYPSRMDACFVDSERVVAQSGDFYGGWITADIVGPFKGDPGTWGW
jgi:uncharacterized protein (DUF427 family)